MLTLGVKRSVFRSDDPEADHHSDAYKAASRLTKKQQNHTCSRCGWVCETTNQTHHLDDDHSNNALENLSVHCLLCHMCCHVGYAAVRRLGTLIWLPEIEQSQLNALCRELWILNSAGTYQADISRLMNELASKSAVCRSKIGTNDPAAFANKLLRADDYEYSRREEYYPGVRLLFNPAAFHRAMPIWSQNHIRNSADFDLIKALIQ